MSAVLSSWLTVSEAARLLDVSPQYLGAMLRENQLPHMVLGGRRLIDASVLSLYLRGRERRARRLQRKEQTDGR